MEYISTTIIIAIVTAGLVSITTLILNYIDKKKENDSYDVLEFVAQVTNIVINTIEKAIETKNISKSDFKTKEEYIDYIADSLSENIEVVLKSLNIYDTCQMVFRGNTTDIIKTIIVNNESTLGLDGEWKTK